MPNQIATQARGILRRLEIALACLACGHDGRLVVQDLRHLPPLPPRCERCGGPVLAMGAAVRYVPDHALPGAQQGMDAARRNGLL
jgi:hypothetical protein